MKYARAEASYGRKLESRLIQDFIAYPLQPSTPWNIRDCRESREAITLREMLPALLAFGLPTVPEMLILSFLLFGIASFVIWIVALINALTNTALKDNEKLIWVLVIVFTHIIGAIIYFAVAPRARRR
ncbi:MAG: PLDc N-terminal domain-containing protein [Chthoniobacterales bacterium]